MRVVQFGAGRIGKIHAKNVSTHPRSRLYGVVDPVAEAGKALADQYGTAFLSEAEALSDPQVDAIVIASATNVHAYLFRRLPKLSQFLSLWSRLEQHQKVNVRACGKELQLCNFLINLPNLEEFSTEK